MFINQHVNVKGAESKSVPYSKEKRYLSLGLSLQPPKKFSSWDKIPRLLDGREKFYDFTELFSGDFSVFCEEKNEYVQIKEGAYVKVGKYYVWFDPCEVIDDDKFYEVKGDCELVLYYSDNLKLKVKA